MTTMEIVLAIVVVVMIARVLRDRAQAQAFIAAQAPPGESPDTQRLRDELRQLRDRVQVLERVVTDSHGSVDLDRQIERLRDR